MGVGEDECYADYESITLAMMSLPGIVTSVAPRLHSGILAALVMSVTKVPAPLPPMMIREISQIQHPSTARTRDNNLDVTMLENGTPTRSGRKIGMK